MKGYWSICRGNHRSQVEIEGDSLPYRVAVHREGLWSLTIGSFLNGEKRHHSIANWSLHPCLRAWRKGQHEYRQGSPSLSTSMEEDLSFPSVFFLVENLIPSNQYFWQDLLILFADLPSQNIALKRYHTKKHTSLIEKSIDLEITWAVNKRVLILLPRKSSIPSWDQGRFASL